MSRARLLVGGLGAIATCASLAACSALLGLEERSLATADAQADVTGDATRDAATESAPCSGTFCECHAHDFCEDFDRYDADGGWREAIRGKWTNSLQYPNPLELFGSLELVSAKGSSSAAEGLALSAATSIPANSNLKVAAGLLIAQVDGTKRPDRVTYVDASWLMRVETLGAEDGGAALLDGGPSTALVSMALVSAGSESDGVGVMLSERGGAIGYALHVNSLFNASIAQGLPFSTTPVSTVGQYYLPYRVRIAHASKLAADGVTCSRGAELSADGGADDAGTGADPLAVVVFPPKVFGDPTCELLGGSLLGDAWLQSPILVIGSVESGPGHAHVEFDDVTLDFNAK